jgi:tetratricopeptide (TPR) repeat protein
MTINRRWWTKCCSELQNIRQERFNELVRARRYEELIEEFPRSVSAWILVLRSSVSLDMVKRGIEMCMKSWHIWSIALDQLGVDSLAEEALESLGHVWDSGDVFAKIADYYKHESNTHIPSMNRFVNKRYIEGSDPSADQLYATKKRYDEQMFPDSRSSFCMDNEFATQYVDALSNWPDDQESLLQQLVLEYNDDPNSWQLYCSWLVEQERLDHAIAVAEKAACEYVAYNPNMKVHAGQVFQQCGHDPTELFLKALESQPDMLECELLEVIAATIPPSKWDLAMFCDSIQYQFALYLMWCETRHNSHLDNLISSIIGRSALDLNEHDLLMFLFAIQTLGTRSDNIAKILRFNARKIFDALPTDNPIFAMVEDIVKNTPAPPRPVSSAPPKPENKPPASQNSGRRVVPGYTPGWLASEYAKKHNI